MEQAWSATNLPIKQPNAAYCQHKLGLVRGPYNLRKNCFNLYEIKTLTFKKFYKQLKLKCCIKNALLFK